MLKQKKQFWITNIHPRKDILIEDLNLVVKSMESKNILDEKHYNYTYEQIRESLVSGSLRKKAQFIRPRVIAPQSNNLKPGIYISKDGRPATQIRSKVKVQELKFEELDDYDDYNYEEDESFTLELADDSYEEHRPMLAVDKKYKNNDE